MVQSSEARALNRIAHERMAELLSRPEASYIADLWVNGEMPHDSKAVALATWLRLHDREIADAQMRLYRDHNPVGGDLVIVVPKYATVWPDERNAFFRGSPVEQAADADEPLTVVWRDQTGRERARAGTAVR